VHPQTDENVGAAVVEVCTSHLQFTAVANEPDHEAAPVAAELRTVTDNLLISGTTVSVTVTKGAVVYNGALGTAIFVLNNATVFKLFVKRSYHPAYDKLFKLGSVAQRVVGTGQTETVVTFTVVTFPAEVEACKNLSLLFAAIAVHVVLVGKASPGALYDKSDNVQITHPLSAHEVEE